MLGASEGVFCERFKRTFLPENSRSISCDNTFDVSGGLVTLFLSTKRGPQIPQEKRFIYFASAKEYREHLKNT